MYRFADKNKKKYYFKKNYRNNRIRWYEKQRQIKINKDRKKINFIIYSKKMKQTVHNP
jgi:hypothetical protein